MAGRPKKPTKLHLINGNPSNIKNLKEKFEAEPKPKLFELYQIEIAKLENEIKKLEEEMRKNLSATKPNLLKLGTQQKKMFDLSAKHKDLTRKHKQFKQMDKLPAPPDFLDDISKEVWWENIGVLIANELFTEADTYSLAGYCICWSQIITATEKIKQMGGSLIFKTSKDENSNYIMSTPFVTIIQKNLTIVKAYASEFGMSPASRGRMSVSKNSEDLDEMEELLSGMRGKAK